MKYTVGVHTVAIWWNCRIPRLTHMLLLLPTTALFRRMDAGLQVIYTPIMVHAEWVINMSRQGS